VFAGGASSNARKLSSVARALAKAASIAASPVGTFTISSRRARSSAVCASAMAADRSRSAEAARLLNEHEMGELFKAIAFAKGLGDYAPLGFAGGDRRHRL